MVASVGRLCQIYSHVNVAEVYVDSAYALVLEGNEGQDEFENI